VHFVSIQSYYSWRVWVGSRRQSMLPYERKRCKKVCTHQRIKRSETSAILTGHEHDNS